MCVCVFPFADLVENLLAIGACTFRLVRKLNRQNLHPPLCSQSPARSRLSCPQKGERANVKQKIEDLGTGMQQPFLLL